MQTCDPYAGRPQTFTRPTRPAVADNPATPCEAIKAPDLCEPDWHWQGLGLRPVIAEPWG